MLPFVTNYKILAVMKVIRFALCGISEEAAPVQFETTLLNNEKLLHNISNVAIQAMF